MVKIIFSIGLYFSVLCVNGATADTINVYSTAMHKEVKAVVISPANYAVAEQRFPVVYLLHGFSGKYSDWIKLVPQIKQMADDYQLLIVCPDGSYGSWYFDSPVDSSFRYETFVSTELTIYIDSHFKTISNRNGRAITGLSMGGHGGLFLGFRHQDIFGACGSMSGGVDLLPFAGKFEIDKRIGDTVHHLQNWKDLSVINLIEHYSDDSLSIIIDCGTEDFFYKYNKNLHQKMLRLGIKHDYIERPGIHNWDYWSNAVIYQLAFFKQYFKKQNHI